LSAQFGGTVKRNLSIARFLGFVSLALRLGSGPDYTTAARFIESTGSNRQDFLVAGVDLNHRPWVMSTNYDLCCVHHDSGFSDAYVMVVPVGFRLIQADFWWIW
jgi:hypothetical protein